MKNEKYQLQSDGRHTHFEFVSVGSKGTMQKLIEFQPTSIPNFYNLAFGDKNPATGKMDDLAVSNNGDMEKVLSTVADAVHKFFEQEPKAIVYATGSTPSRTRLYRMGLTKFYTEIQEEFYLFGQIGDEAFIFEPGTDYEGFVVRRKI